MTTIQNFINGQHVDPVGGEFLDNVNPATGQAYGKIPKSGAKDVENAIAAAKAAFPGWKATSVLERAKILRKFADLIRRNFDELAIAETNDNGKPISVSRNVDIPRASSNFEYFADAATQTKTETYDMGATGLNYTLREPLGVVSIISPWNLPLYLFTWKIAPALVHGNTVVAKPSEVTPMTAYLFTQFCKEAGLPDGVLNVIHGIGSDVGDTLTTHPDVKAISFTGSTATGKVIARNAAPLFKKVSLEMGGKNPNIIFADADFDKALETTMRSSFANQGQICLCGSRVYIERSLYEKFKNALIEKTKNLIQANPLDEKTQQGAVVSREHFEKILTWIDKAKTEGGKILIGGAAAKLSGDFSNGYFIQPTIIENLDHNCETNQIEIFGPVITLTPFDTEEEVLTWANSTVYGLAGSLWTKDIDRAHRMARKIDTGVFWINTWMLRDLRVPFGGVKNSGMGREGGDESYRFFTQLKNITLAIGE